MRKCRLPEVEGAGTSELKGGYELDAITLYMTVLLCVFSESKKFFIKLQSETLVVESPPPGAIGLS